MISHPVLSKTNPTAQRVHIYIYNVDNDIQTIQLFIQICK